MELSVVALWPAVGETRGRSQSVRGGGDVLHEHEQEKCIAKTIFKIHHNTRKITYNMCHYSTHSSRFRQAGMHIQFFKR